MKFKTILGLLIALIFCSCNRRISKDGNQIKKGPDQQLELKSGLRIEYGPNLGAIDKYTAGDYIFITATITNDSIIPIHLQVGISEEYEFPDSCINNKYKVFLLPKELTPDTATLYNNLTDGLGNFLDKCLDNPYVLNKTLKPGEYAIITIGALNLRLTKCSVSALPRAVFVQGDDHNFQACDSRMPARPAGGNQDKSTKPQLTLGVKLVFYRGKSQPETCILLPCGQISYPKH